MQRVMAFLWVEIMRIFGLNMEWAFLKDYGKIIVKSNKLRS